MPAVAEWSWVDLALAGVLLLSVLVGIWRGLVFELMSLVGWVVAYFAAQQLTAPVAAWLPVGEPGSPVQQALAFGLSFFGVLILWGLVARLVRSLIQATPLTGIDRFLGAGFGALRGGVLLLVVAMLVMLTPAARSQPWQGSQGAAWLSTALASIRPLLPDAIGRHLPGALPPSPDVPATPERQSLFFNIGVIPPCAASSVSSRVHRSIS